MANQINPKRLKKCRGHALATCGVCYGPACKDAQGYNCQECCYYHRSCIMQKTGMDVVPMIGKMGGLEYKFCSKCESLVDIETHVCLASDGVDWLDLMRRLK